MVRARAADARVTINGVAYAFQRVRRGGRVNPIGVANSEGIPGNVNGNQNSEGFDACLPDIRGGEFTLSQAVFDSANSPYEAPISLVEGEYYEIVFYPAGLAGPEADMGACLCIETSDEGTVGGGAMIPSATFKTDGVYTVPGEGS